MRYAIYFTPPVGERLTRLASNWLGRNAFSGAVQEAQAVGPLSAADVAHYTAAPRRYGFHGTLKAPFELAPEVGEADLLRAMMDFCAAAAPLVMPRLRIERLGPFFALTPDRPLPELAALAARIVRDFDRFRAPLSDADIERRNPDRLTRVQLANLYRWGYPYVHDEFRFHMTLTGPVETERAPMVEAVLQELFEPVLSDPLAVANIALFVESTPGEPFIVHSLHPLGSVATRKSA